MARPKRSKKQREADLVTIASLYTKGKTQVEIAQEIGVTRQQIAYDIQDVIQRWRESILADINDAKARELAKLDHLEATHWVGWERSIEAFRSKTVKDGGPNGRETTRKVEERVGDPRFLEGVARCIEQRCKILGINAPAKIQPVGPDGEPQGFGVLIVPGVAGPEEWAQRAAEQQAELMREADGGGD